MAAIAGVVAPSGAPRGFLRIVAVQGGGVRGYRAVERDPAEAFDAQVRATGLVRPPVDVLLWPEDVIDVTRLQGSAEAARLSATARGLSLPAEATKLPLPRRSCSAAYALVARADVRSPARAFHSRSIWRSIGG